MPDQGRQRSGFPTIQPGGGDTAQPRNLRKRLRLLASQGVTSGRCVLDGGCGRGGLRSRAAGLGVHAFGAEFLADKVRSQPPGIPGGAILRADLEHLPYGPSSFDVVFLNEVLEHVPDELRRSAKSGACSGRGGRSSSCLPTGSTHSRPTASTCFAPGDGPSLRPLHTLRTLGGWPAALPLLGSNLLGT